MDRPLFITLMAYTIVMLFLYLLFTVLSPFLAMLVWAGAIGIITYPLYEKLLHRCNGHEITAAALMTSFLALALVVPLIGLTVTLSQEATLAYQHLEKFTSSPGVTLNSILQHPMIAPWRERLAPLLGSRELNLDVMVVPTVKNVLAAVLDYSTELVRNFLTFLFKLVLMAITLFFIYKDGLHFTQRFWQVLDLKETLRTTIISTISRVLGAVMYGIILTCLMQGTLGGLGFWVAGLPSPILFGTLTAICAPIPFIGTALVWLPGAIYLLIQGQTLHGVLLIAWGVIVVSGIDNILRPLFISGKARLPILIIVFGVLGGILSFGLSGVVAGPVLLAIVMVFFEEYRQGTSAIQG